MASALHSSLNVFEGPEKKLDLRFSSAASDPDQALGSDSDSTCPSVSMDRVSSVLGLRALDRDDIQAILDAAACHVLSTITNQFVDAYLLSESSLFISSHHLMIKTCGTTQLLHALPVILKLVHQKLDLKLDTVHFSRVSYLFPHEQPAPHDSFRSEVAYLDTYLGVSGNVFITPPVHGSSWHSYIADFRGPADTYLGQHQQNHAHQNCIEKEGGIMGNCALELYMFDLDPDIMKRFVFNNRPHRIGADRLKDGITEETGIHKLIDDETIVDAFNFEPCGYSMNGILDASYYTIHVSPEEMAPYVSFETSAPIKHVFGLIASVVKLFRPGRFKVARTRTGRRTKTNVATEQGLSWHRLTKLLRLQGFQLDQAVKSDETNTCEAHVAAFSLITAVSSANRCFAAQEHNSIKENLKLQLMKLSDSGILDQETSANIMGNLRKVPGVILKGRLPKYLIDLGLVMRNVSAIIKGTLDGQHRLRYNVSCNADKLILSLLSQLDIDFEIKNTRELSLVQTVGVPRGRIVLATPVLTEKLLDSMGLIGMVSIHGEPSESVMKAVRSYKVQVELRICASDVGQLSELLGQLVNMTDNICSVYIRFKASDVADGWQNVRRVLRYAHLCVSELPEYIRKRVSVNVGELIWHEVQRMRRLGGGPGQLFEKIQEITNVCKQAMGLDVSRLTVHNAACLILSVTGKRKRKTWKQGEVHNYFLEDGVYGALNQVIMEPIESRYGFEPIALHSLCGEEEEDDVMLYLEDNEDKRLKKCTLFGPTCDSIDTIWSGEMEEMEVGDAVLFRNVGCYALIGATRFNGYGGEYEISYVASDE